MRSITISFVCGMCLLLMIMAAVLPNVDGQNSSQRTVGFENAPSIFLASDVTTGQNEISEGSTSPALGFESHLMTESEMEAERARVGVYDPTINYDVTSSGLSAGAHPPTEAQWESMVGTQIVIDSAVSEIASPGSSSVDLSQSNYFPPVGDQGLINSCSAWSETYYSYGYLEAKDNGWTDAHLGNPAHLMSPTWTYNKQNGGISGGSSLGDNIKIVKDFGAATMDMMPNSTNYIDWGSEMAWREAPLHRAQDFVLINYDPSTVISALKSVLASGTPINFRLDANLFSDYYADSLGNKNNILSSSEYTSTTTNHAQTIVGFSDTIGDNGETGSFKIVNSWGTSFGRSGYYYITYQAFLKVAKHTLLGYVVDLPNSQPTLLGVWHFDNPPTRDASITVQAIDVPTGHLLGQKTPYILAGSANRMPTFMCLDISTLASYANNPNIKFVLQIGSSNGYGSLSSFRIEQYQGLYQPGKASCISNQASGLPATNPCSISSLQTNQQPIAISDAMGWYDGAFSYAGTAQWLGISGGNGSSSSMQSGDVGDQSSSKLISFIEGPGTLTFDWRVSSEPENDFLRFYYDGTLNSQISGEKGWSKVSCTISAGVHYATWSYEKDADKSAKQDCGWLDNVNWTGRSALAFDDFEAGSGLHWISTDNNAASGIDTWGNSTHRAFSGQLSAWCSQIGTGTNKLPNYLNYHYDENMDSRMEANLPDMTGLSDMHLSFRYWASTGSTSLSDYAFLQVYQNSTWKTFWTQPSINSNGWKSAQVIIPADATKVAFCFHSDGSVGSGPYEGVYVDDVLLTVLDSQAPTSSIEHLSSYTKTDHVTLNCVVTDTGGSGFNSVQIHYRKGNSGPYALYTTTSNPTGIWTSKVIDFKFASVGGSEGMYQFYSIATDNAGMTEAAPSTYEAFIIFDVTSPVTTANLGGALAPAWNNHIMTVALSATDVTSGVSKTFYSLDGSALTAYTKPIVISGQGGHVMRYNSTDNAGNVETAKSISFNIDTVSPTLSISSPINRSHSNSGNVTVKWTAGDGGSGMARIEVCIDQANWIMASGTSYSFGGLSDGAHTINVRVTDNAGNSEMASVTFDVDTVAPLITITSPEDGLHTDATGVQMNWTAVDKTTSVAYMHVWNDTHAFINMTSGDGYVFIGLSEGSHVLHLMVWDMVGNSQEKTVSIIVDRTAPEITITYPQWGQRVNDTVINATWIALDNLSSVVKIEVSIDDGNYVDIGTSTFNHFAGVLEGDHTINVRATDSAGNVAIQDSFFTVERTAPIVISHLPLTGAIVLPNAVVKVTFSEVMNQSTVTFTGITGTMTWNIAGTEVELIHFALAYATQYNISISGNDLVGNALTGSNLGWSFTTVTQVTGTVNDIIGNPVANATVTLTQGTAVIEGATDANGHFGLLVNGGIYNLTLSRDRFQSLERNDMAFGVGHNNTLGTLVMASIILPHAPTGLIATPSNDQVSLSWTAPAFNGSSAIDHYVVYQDGVALPNNPTSLTTVITGLVNGQNYSFKVAAHNLAGIGGQSGAVSSIPYTVSNAPTGLTATLSNAQVTLNWTEPAFSGGRVIDYYVIYQDGIALADHPNGLTFNVVGLSNGQEYDFTVAAHNLAGTGAMSNVASSIPRTFPTAPVGLLAIANNSQVSLNWSVPTSNGGTSIIDYNIYRSTTVAGNYSLIASHSGLAYNDTGLAKGQTYWYRVSAVNGFGEGTNCSAAFVSVPQITSPADDATMPIWVAVIAIAVVLVASLLILRRRKGNM